MEQLLLELRDLGVTYGQGVTALHAVNLGVAPGQVVTVLGANGAGKSSLLRAVSGSLRSQGGSTTGEIAFASRRIDGLAPERIVKAGIAHVPEGRRVFKDFTVEENLRAGAYLTPRGAARDAAFERVYDTFPDLAGRRTQQAGLLSGGQQQMLAMGRALMSDPRLLLLDEPSLGLAPKLVEQIGVLIGRIREQGAAVLLIEQNSVMSLAVSDTAYLLEIGEVTLSGPAADLAASDEIRERYLPPVDAVSDGPGAVPPSAVDPRDRADTGASLVARGVTKNYGGVAALKAVDLDVSAGSIHAIIGPNGAGKSTLVNLLSGVASADEGEILVGGTSIMGLSAHRRAALGMSRTFQNLALAEECSVLDNLLVGRHRLWRGGVVRDLIGRRGARDEHRAAVQEMAEAFGLAELMDRPVGSLAYGDRKRVELARAACARPSVMMLDEPVAGMNHGESDDMRRAISAVHRLFRPTIIVIEHDMPFVMQIAERITVLDFGRVIASGTPEMVRQDPAVIEAYLGGDVHHAAIS
jgi:ABC-type branched-subunit amino acid transport system ATPase component